MRPELEKAFMKSKGIRVKCVRKGTLLLTVDPNYKIYILY